MYLFVLAWVKKFNKIQPCQITSMLYCCKYLVVFSTIGIQQKIGKMREIKTLNTLINMGAPFHSTVFLTHAAFPHLVKSVSTLES
jgi:formylmethanofuran dehydrogenase subunit B